MQYHLDGQAEHERIFAAGPLIVREVVSITLCSDVMRKWAHKLLHNSALVMDSTFGTNRWAYSLFVS